MNEPSMKKKVLISGSGVAGILCALSLDAEKYDIEIIERADSFRNIGFSITLWKSGFTHIKGVLSKHEQSFIEGKDYFPVNSFTFFGGMKLKKLKQLSSKGYAWCIEREHLMDILEKALLSKIKSEQLSFSTTVDTVQENNEGVLVRFNGGKSKTYDFVLVAEGINSTTRSLIFPTQERIIPLGQNLRYAWFDKETDLQDGGALFFTQHHIGVIHPPYTRNLLGYYFKDGTSSLNQQVFERKMFSVIKQPAGQETSLDHETSHVFNLKNVYLPQYHSKRIVLIGDAAHGRPPTLGFGTSLAVEDSIAISRLLNESDSLNMIESKLENFSRTRSRRIEKIYRFQGFIHKFITGNIFKVRILSVCLKLFYARYIEYKIKRFASYEVQTDSSI
ncbi:MAG: NAD(P)/FAD-dependent oxidoreductase [Bacteroidota bacterium]